MVDEGLPHGVFQAIFVNPINNEADFGFYHKSSLENDCGAADIDHMVLNHLFQVMAGIMGLKLLISWYGEIDVPGDVRGFFPFQCHLHDDYFIQFWSPGKCQVLPCHGLDILIELPAGS
jgi:hypothetical protein